MFRASAGGKKIVRPALFQSYAEISRYVRQQGLLTTCGWSNHAVGVSRRGFVSSSSLHMTKPLSPSENLLDQPAVVRPADHVPPQASFLQAYRQSFHFPTASHEIKDLDSLSPGQEVTLHGYLGSRADLGSSLSFAPLISKGLGHSVQLMTQKTSSKEVLNLFRSLNEHTPVAIRGTVKERKQPKNNSPANQEVPKRIINIEVVLTELLPLNKFPDDIKLYENSTPPPEQRHLQIRTDHALRKALTFRSKAAAICRDDLSNRNDFVEIETPILFKSTPEGAREFLVPTRTKGLAYALPQSPQQYKQILMASGIPRYFQLARCFRDEDLRADRQPEFTQLDLEMAFAAGEDVMNCIEGLIRRLWAELLHEDLQKEFPRMKYHEAMAKYGSDKPDIRLGMEISRMEYLLPVDLIGKIGPLIDPAVDIMKFRVSDQPSETRKFVIEFMDSPEAIPFNENPDGQPGIFIFDSRKPLQGLTPFGFEAAERAEEMLDLEDGDLVIIQARKNVPFSGGSTAMGRLRLALHKAAVARGYVEAPKGWEFLWITDFPLFSPENDTDPGQGGAAGFSSTHHPFTAPKTAEDVDLLSKDPASVIAEHYDLVLNGVELGGGSRRIHDAEVQEYVLRDVLKINEERLQDFRHLLEVLRAGCPPHAGIALGFDRLIAVMLGKDSVREVIAFPKSGKGEDLLVKAPNMVTKEQLETYHLELKR